MPIQSAGILAGSTAGSETGGSALTLAPTGRTVKNGIEVYVTSDTDFRTRRTFTFTYKPPVLQPDGLYSKAKFVAVHKQPVINTAGKIEFDIIRIEKELSNNEANGVTRSTALNCFARQMIGDADFSNFWAAGSPA